MDKQVVAWHGDLLWPQELPDAEVIDLSDVRAAGAWIVDWFRRHPNRTVVGGSDFIKRQLRRGGAPVFWSDSLGSASQQTGGVSPSEREMLWN
jgi:hypothetical protein